MNGQQLIRLLEAITGVTILHHFTYKVTAFSKSGAKKLAQKFAQIKK